ncbi:MAG: hypothetical protein QOI21_1062 [Actinomycetota bacterium]|jgi:GAF domain-containing protein|nr:hypothetical protein [Actinomycetota bacterium]
MTVDVRQLGDHLDDVTSALEVLTSILERDPGTEVTLQVVCEQVIRVIPGADLASITLIRDGEPRTVASTDQRAVDIDTVQYQAGDGPCLRAAKTGEPVRLDTDTARDLWPRFADSARALGVGSYLAAPLVVDENLSGAVNLFGFGSHGFREVENRLLELFAAFVVFGLRSARRYSTDQEVIAQLRHAMASRAVIEQAKGILMATHKITAAEAFEMLVVRSQHDNDKLHDVAARFVAEVSAAE